MLKRFLALVTIIIFTVGCSISEYTFQVKNDIIVFNQSEEKFDIKMLEQYISLYYGESEESLSEYAKVSGEVDLSKVGTYPIKLYASYKNKLSEVEVNVLVVDTKNPQFYIFENELLIYKDENIKIDAAHFYINLIDGINGQINERISHNGEYDVSKVSTYPIQLTGIDSSGNEIVENLNLRVTDIIDEKALYLYKKANAAVHGETFVFENDNKNAKILNFQDALAVFTPSFREHFYWLSGITGEYNNLQSGVQLSFVDKDAYADFSKANKVNGYKQTKLSLQYESDDSRHYVARSYYEENNEEVIKLAKFVIKKIDGVWYVDEFYMLN